MNTVQLKNLKSSINPGQKSPVLLFDNDTSVRSTIYLEELNDFIKSPSSSFKQGNSLYLRAGTNNPQIRLSGTLNPTTNIISYPYSEVEQSYNIYSEGLNLNFENNLLKECFVGVKNEMPTTLIFTNGLFHEIDFSACPTINAIYVNNQNCLDCNILDLRTLFNFNILSCIFNNNKIKYLLGYSRFLDKNYVIFNAHNFKILNVGINNVVPFIQYEPRYPTLTKFYLPVYVKDDFSQEELDMANSKNIELINVK